MNPRLWHWNGTEWVFRPSSSAQRRYLESAAPEILFSGHLGNGKSSGVAMKFLQWGDRWPRTPMALVRKAFNDLKTSTLRTMESFFPPALWRGGLVGGEHAYRLDFPNGSFVDFAGLDRASKFQSTEYALIQVEEATEITLHDWETMAGRLRAHAAPISQIGAVTNPEAPTHWLARRFDPNQGSHRITGPCPGMSETVPCAGSTCRRCRGAGKIVTGEVIVAGFGDNDANLPRAYVERRARYKGARYQRWVRGLWVAFEGAVFGDYWNPDVHVAPNSTVPGSTRFPGRPAAWDAWNGFPPPDWPRYRAIDFGFTNPFVCSWYAEDPEGTLWRYREIYKSGVRTEVHGRRMLALEEDELQALRAAPGIGTEDDARRYWKKIRRLNLDLTVTDHDPEAQATLGRMGIECVNAVKDRNAAMQAVERALEAKRVVFLRNSTDEIDEDLAAEGAPTSTEEEIPELRFPKKGIATNVEERERESPFAKDDHGYSALCYLLLTRERVWKV